MGERGYGSVYKGKLQSGHLVAIKMLDKSKVVRALALENANAISKENLAFTTLKSSTSENCKGKYCKFFAILATVQF